jgi:hypothetical protein
MANFTDKFRLTFAVGFLAMPTARTSAAGVARVNCDYFNSFHSRLVFNKGAQLKEGPSGNLCSLWLAKLFASVTYALEVFKGYVSRSAFSQHNELFADLVVDVSPETRFAFRNSLEFTACVQWTFAAILLLIAVALKRLTLRMITKSDSLNFFAAMRRAVAIGRKVDDSQINAKKIRSWNGRVFGQVNGYEQEPFSIFSQNQIALPFRESESLLLIATHNEGNDDAFIQGLDRNTVKPLEAHQMIIKRHRRMLAKLWLDGFVSFEGLAHLSNTADSKLSRQGESNTQLGVVEFLQMKLICSLSLKGFLSKPVGSFIECFNSLTQLNGLLFVWKQLSLQGKFHPSSIGYNWNLSIALDNRFAAAYAETKQCETHHHE